jgi:antitoxin component YwqK of YwqJK toxin-antitoxin module
MRSAAARRLVVFPIAVALLTPTMTAGQSERVVNRNSAGQVIETYTMVDGQRQGPAATFYDNGARKSERVFVDGKVSGRAVEYHQNGIVMRDGTFEAGQLIGSWSQYYPTGQLEMRGQASGSQEYYENVLDRPIRSGVWTTYYPDGSKRSEGGYDKGTMSGPWREYHVNGNVLRDVTFADGSLTGTWSQYYETGQLEMRGQASGSEQYYRNTLDRPIRSGVWTTYYPDGSKRSEGGYDKGTMSGPWREYHASGNVLRDVTFADGSLTGTWSQYYETGQLAIQGHAAGSQPYWRNSTTHPLRSGVWVTFDAAGRVTDATIYVDNLATGKASYATDATTGVTTIPYTLPDGSRGIVEVDSNGRVERGPSAGDGDEAGDLVAASENTATGEVTTVRRNADGSTTTYRGVKRRDPDGTERLVETDEEGNRIETAVAPDGTVTVVHSVPGQGETKMVTMPDGRATTVERDAEGSTRSTTLAPDGLVITERRDPTGALVETIRDMPDGWREHVSPSGNSRLVLETDDATTTITMDRSGNTTTTVRDRSGTVLTTETDVIAPREPGRAYFEQVLKGDDWDALPQHLRSRYADSERRTQQLQAQRAEEDAAELRRKIEDAKRAAETAAMADETRKTFEALQADQAAADRIAAQRRAAVERRAEVEKSYETARDLQQQYDQAVAAGNRAEAMSILERQDEHHEKSMELLRQTPEELQALQRHSDMRARIASDIASQAYQAAEAKLAEDTALQDAKDRVTGVTKFVSIGSQMQQATGPTTRSANRERTIAEAKRREIDRRLADPATTREQREILRDLQAMADLQEAGAGELLAANARITAAGYGLDAVTTLTGAKAVMAGGTTVKATAGAVGTALGRRSAAQAGTGSAGGAAGGTTIALAEGAGRTAMRTSRLTPAERQVLLESRASTDLSRIVGRDVLPGPIAPRPAVEFTRSELARLHAPGANLTRAEIIKKADIYRARESARARLTDALRRNVPDSALGPIQAEFQRLNRLISEAITAGRTSF